MPLIKARGDDPEREACAAVEAMKLTREIAKK